MAEQTKVKRNGRTKTILYVGDRSGFYARELIRGVLSVRAMGVDWNVCGLHQVLTRRELREYLEKNPVDGVIGRGLSEGMMAEFAALGIPSVMMRAFERGESKYLNGPHADDAKIGELAGEHFFYLRLGYWGFVHLEGMGWSDARQKSFHSYATSHGVSNETLSLDGERNGEWSSVKQIAEWLESLPKPCGVLACNDLVGLDVLYACQLLGLSVPDEVAVVGVDNDRLLCETALTSLSSIDLQAMDMGRAAAVQLGKMMGDLDGTVEVLSRKAFCVVRGSSRRVDQARLIVQKALDVMELRPLEKNSVESLARVCGVSRRGLERAFEKCESEAPGVLMRKKRLAVILDLLRDEGMSLEGISEQAGFGDVSSFSNFVKRMTGKSPGRLRQ